MGAWIEIIDNSFADVASVSLPVWERGLKYAAADNMAGRVWSLPVWERGCWNLSPYTCGFMRVKVFIKQYCKVFILQ